MTTTFPPSLPADAHGLFVGCVTLLALCLAVMLSSPCYPIPGLRGWSLTAMAWLLGIGAAVSAAVVLGGP